MRDGALDEEPYWLDASTADRFESKRAVPGDILVSASGTIGKVALIGAERPGGVLFDTSIRRVRITAAGILPEAVAAFLRSELGQQQFRRLTSGTVIPHLVSAHLSQVRVFLATESSRETTLKEPATAVVTQPVLTQAQALAQALDEQVLDVLRRVDESDDGAWRQRIAISLQQLASELVPKPLADVLRQELPAPLAIAYRRYHMAQHNPYEQLDRMINLVEACTYFAFHVLVADYGRAEWSARVTLPKEAEGALKPRATFDDRIHFIRAITANVRQHRLDLFVPELVDSEVEVYADRFRTQLRNPVAHSAPGSEAYVRDLVNQHGCSSQVARVRVRDSARIVLVRA